ncbi:MAG: ABC-F family ATP-binding cassette domain-containing protein [Sulfuricurvum sp.]|jgi:ATP-binding cassette subfamily F protein uup|uniref:ribosomal protection-like ABC-F family protein n=1 Tax=Sulfuricurvum sp. TaxID=2025608 RepID=UPI0025EB3F3A|nr:ABC-F family ATP-binding cassette domain-containing protein [Sulfuricurvum sp.]MCK9373803.1 ABC-F family ATP-binding cassette domain-containing protein [Sulfuricurvum sp.]
MALVDLLNVSKHYEAQKILENINFHIDEGERVVIVGKNGSGKSTLMKIVHGSLDTDAGERITRQGIEIKMLSQVPKFDPDHNVREAIEAGLGELKSAKVRFDEISHLLAEEFDNAALLDEQARLTNFLDHHNAWNLDDKIERVMHHFMLKEYETKKVDLLSGGEQRRVALASILLQKPDILLLDEPTNHLDVYMVEFLEELILKERFTLLFISHDRYFIDQIATKTIEVEDCSLREFSGGYSNYLEQKQELLRTMAQQHDNLLKLLKTENEWLRRGVKARLKRNEGRKQRVLQLREDAKNNPSKIRKMKLELEREAKHFNRSEGINRQKMLFEIEHLGLTLGDKLLIKDFSTRILQKDVIAVVGPNGSGKSTLLKALLGRLKPTSGMIKQGDLTIGYFDQHREMLDDNLNLIETFCPHGGDRVDAQGQDYHVYGYLKNFLFPREFLDKKIGVLSGGEKNRVALALLFTKKVDILILDEPTNDLDIPTINILEEKLQSFPGAVILVSHDRYFVDKIAKKLFIFKGDGTIEESYKPYSEYLEDEKEFQEMEAMEEEFSKPAAATVPVQTEKPKILKLTFNEQKALEKLPVEIDALETKIDELGAALADPKQYEKIGITVLAEELEKVKALYEIKVDELLNIEEKRETIEALKNT